MDYGMVSIKTDSPRNIVLDNLLAVEYTLLHSPVFKDLPVLLKKFTNAEMFSYYEPVIKDDNYLGECIIFDFTSRFSDNRTFERFSKKMDDLYIEMLRYRMFDESSNSAHRC